MNTLTYHLWKPTFAKKMVFINGYGFHLRFFFPFFVNFDRLKLRNWTGALPSHGFPLQVYGFQLHPHFWQNLFSAEKFKIFGFLSKLHVQESIIGQPKSTNFLEEF